MAFGNKNSTPSFALTLPMKVTKQDEIFLSKKFRIGCMVYNQMVTKTTKMWHQLRKTREYKNLVKAIKAAPANSDERKALLVKRSNLIKQAGFSEGVFHKLVVPYQKAYNVNCDVAQKVASAVWKAWNDFFYGKGKTVHYKKLDDFVTLSGKKNNCGIFFRPANHTVSSLESAKRKAKNSIEKRYFDAFRKPDAKEGKEVVLPNEVKAQMEKEIADATAKIEPYIGDGNLRIIYEKHEFLVKVRNPDTQTGKYQQEALKCGIKYCRIVRSWVGTKWKYYAQLILEGYPPIKCDSNGVAKHPVKEGRIGIDIGTQTIAFCGKDVCDLRILAPSAIAEARNGLTKEIARVMRQMDRSRRAMNPQYYNENGTIKRLKRKNGHRQIRHWNYSKNYYRLLYKLRDLNRKLAAVRKTEHYILANELLTYGNEFVVEDMNYKALQKRSNIPKSDSVNLSDAALPQCLFLFLDKKQVVTAVALSRSAPLKRKLRSLTIPMIVIPRKSCPSVLLSFPTEPLFSGICIPHFFYCILGKTFNPTTRKPLRKISRSLRNCTMKRKSACKTATNGCLQA